MNISEHKRFDNHLKDFTNLKFMVYEFNKNKPDLFADS